MIDWRMRLKQFVIAAALLMLAPGVAALAQEAPGRAYVLSDTEVWPVPDPVSGRQYEVFVGLPPSYNEDATRRYPVLYIADADYGFPLIRSIARRINLEGPVTDDFILVGLSYAKGEDGMVSRRRDYTPVPQAGRAGTGEAPGYQRYLRDTVLPFVEGRFRAAAGERVFMGHSYGALLGTQILLTEPTLFRKYILGSPSLWYGKRAMFDLEAAYAKTARDLPAEVFLYVGEYEAVKSGDRRYNRSTDMVKDLASFEKRLRSRGYDGLRVNSNVLVGENHLTVFPAGFTWGILQALPAGG